MNKIKLLLDDGATLAEIGTGHKKYCYCGNASKKICLQKEISFVTRRSGFFRLGYDLIKKQDILKIDDRYLNWSSKSDMPLANSNGYFNFDRLSTTYDFMSSLKINLNSLSHLMT